MKVLLASSSSGSHGGGELYLLYLGRALVERGHDVTLWASSHPRMDELASDFATIGPVVRSRYANTYDRRGRSLTSYFDGTTASRIAAEWRQIAPDVIHVNKQNLEDGLDLLQAAEASGCAHLATVHLTQSARYLRAQLAAPRDWVARRALKAYGGLLVAVLEKRRTDLAEFIGASSRTRVIPNGVPLLDLSRRESARNRREEFGVTPDQLLFVAVGRLVPQKRPLTFLETAQRVLRVMPQARFLWVGDGPLAGEWDDWLAAHELGAFVRRLDWQKDVASLLLAADVFLHVAEYEGLPLAILEAMSAALPCAISENLLAEMPFLGAHTAVAVNDGVEWLRPLHTPEARAALGSAARRLAEEEFSFGTMAARYEALYEESVRMRA
jgi:glycosyltransferase involved in cell wall biosynthesis